MNIILKRISPSDADKIVKWKSDPELSKQIMSHYRAIDHEEALEWIEKNSSDTHQRLNGIYFDNGETLELLGITRLMFIDFESKNAEFGIYIGDEKYQGKGIGSKALRLTIDQAFDFLYLKKIFLKVSGSNQSAIKLYQKFNFVIEGILKEHHFQNGVFEDIIYMALFNPVEG